MDWGLNLNPPTARTTTQLEIQTLNPSPKRKVLRSLRSQGKIYATTDVELTYKGDAPAARSCTEALGDPRDEGFKLQLLIWGLGCEGVWGFRAKGFSALGLRAVATEPQIPVPTSPEKTVELKDLQGYRFRDYRCGAWAQCLCGVDQHRDAG